MNTWTMRVDKHFVPWLSLRGPSRLFWGCMIAFQPENEILSGPKTAYHDLKSVPQRLFGTCYHAVKSDPAWPLPY
jgi:hypothetical protein